MRPYQLFKGAMQAVRERFRSPPREANEVILPAPSLNAPEPPELTALLAAIVAEPHEETLWLAVADWLEENDDVRRGELLRLHRKLLSTCCEPEAHLERATWQAHIVELIAAGVKPCVLQKELRLSGGVPMTFSFIPPGSFLMGGTVYDREDPIHKVTLTSGFFLGISAVTQAQWHAVMGTNPSGFNGPNRPVENVSWFDCQEFCRKLTGLSRRGCVKLPTEAQWEYACRAGTTTEYHFGDIINTHLANYNGNEAWNGSPLGRYREETTGVGSFPGNAWGLYDMHGNVAEWCHDGERQYSPGEQTDPQGNSNEGRRAVRGGSWPRSPEVSRSSHRNFWEPADSGYDFGFRVCFHLA